MKRLSSTAVLGAVLLGLVAPAWPARGPKPGVSGKMDGMRFRATGRVLKKSPARASYEVIPDVGAVAFALAAAELPRRRGVQQILVIACASETATLPWTATCTASYSEVGCKRLSITQKI